MQLACQEPRAGFSNEELRQSDSDLDAKVTIKNTVLFRQDPISKQIPAKIKPPL